MLRLVGVIVGLLLFPVVAWAQSNEVELTTDNWNAWKEHVLPAQDEMEWMQIPWLTTFADGIAAANKADKPLLLWVMNGHPLGCT